jgi:hypothetical protein
MCQIVIMSAELEDLKHSFEGEFLNKNMAILWLDE